MFKSTRKMVLVASAVMLFGYCGGTNKAFAFTGIINPSELPIVQSVNTAKVKCELGINNLNYAEVAVTVTGKAGTSKITTKICIQKYDDKEAKWMNVKKWEYSKNSSRVSYSEKYKLSKKGKYRCKLISSVHCNGVSEEISALSQICKY